MLCLNAGRERLHGLHDAYVRRSVVLDDDRRIRRHISVDFNIPKGIGAEELSDSFRLVPLALLQKAVLRDLDVRDDRGRSLAVLTQGQNTIVATECLIALAEQVLNSAAVPAGLRDEIRTIAGASAQDGLAMVDSFAQRTPNRRQRQRLWRDIDFQALMRDFAQNFVLLIVSPAAVGERTVVKFSYEEQLGGGHLPGLTRLFGRISFRTVEARVDLSSAVGSAQSYHVEVPSPEDIRIVEGTLISVRPDDTTDLQSETCKERTHFHVTDMPRGTEAYLFLTFGIQPTGILTAIFNVSLITLGLLSAGLFLRYWFGKAPITNTTPAVVLVLTALLSAYLFRPGEHRLLRRLLSGLRLEALALTIIALIASGSIVVGWPPYWRLGIWIVLWLVALLVSISVAVVLVGERWRQSD